MALYLTDKCKKPNSEFDDIEEWSRFKNSVKRLCDSVHSA